MLLRPLQSEGATVSAPDTLSRQQFVEPIRASEARGNSRPVTHAEFQHIAGEGQAYLQHLASHPAGTRGLDRHWDTIKQTAYESAQEPWGGVTVNARTGRSLHPRAQVYAVTAKHPGQESVSVPVGASHEEFGAAMDRAREAFPQLAHKNHHIGVFHDVDENRIDIDPVVVVRRKEHAEQIGAATHNIGGAFNPRSGNGYFPPHVAD